MQKQGVNQPLTNINSCKSCAIRNKGCGVIDTKLKYQCPCSTCLVGTMCKEICMERLCLTEKHRILLGT
jgi:hypothetical protein